MTIAVRQAPSRKGAPVAACIALASLCVAAPAPAGTINLTYMGAGNGRIIRASVGSMSWDVFAGRLLHRRVGSAPEMPGAPSILTTFSADILQDAANVPGTFNTSSLALLSGNTGLTNLGFGKQQAIYDLYQAAGNRQFTAGLDYATAFQVAIWEVVYDYSPSSPNHGLNERTGTFRATAPGQTSLSASIQEKVRFLLSSVGNGAAQQGLVGLRSGQFLDQIYSADSILVPVHSAAWLGLGGLGLTALARWRWRRGWRRA